MTLRIGNCSGYYGDRLSAMREMLEGSAVEGGELDFLTGDYLAELTMLILGRDVMKDPSTGYAKSFVRQMTDCFALAREKGVKIVANSGGLNPAGLAEKLREVAAEQGVDVVVAHVEGDDLRERAEELQFGSVLTANAYLGAFGIAEALNRGADVVVTGRVTDASVVVGPAIAHHGWGRDDFDALAGAVVAGHVIECGTQATGGNFSGFTGIDMSRPLGFPIAEVAADGSSVITKHDGTGGAVTVDTVTAQLMYEVGGPVYLGPDASTRLDTMALAQEGPDRVSITGVVGAPPPSDVKVCLNTVGGFRNVVEFLLTGLDIPEKAALVKAQMESAFDAGTRPDEVEWRLDRTDVIDPPTEAAGTALLQCHVKSSEPDPVGRSFSDAAIQIALASYPGFSVTRPPSAGVPFGVYRPAFVPQSDVPHVVVLADGTRIDIEPPKDTTEKAASGANSSRLTTGSDMSAPLAEQFAPLGEWVQETVRVPLGRLVHARSGDKGGDANLGVWIPADHPRREPAFTWLAAFLDEVAVRELLPEASKLELEIHPLPNLAAVNVVIHGLLGEGVSSSTRLDPQAKGLGEWFRAREADVPKELLA
jgi:hypothetical protein